MFSGDEAAGRAGDTGGGGVGAQVSPLGWEHISAACLCRASMFCGPRGTAGTHRGVTRHILAESGQEPSARQKYPVRSRAALWEG